jgi:CubicO group peptidase (beta-lactamase class C family)
MTYYPPRDAAWPARRPAELAMRADALRAAMEYHLAHETIWQRDFLTESGRYIGVADELAAPGEVLGPIRPRGGPSAVILRHGYIVAEWGDTSRADMSFSVAKSYLAVLAGVAVARRLIRNIEVPARGYALDDGFESPQNRLITWRHLLEQTSEWQGTLWGKPDSIDHNRDVGRSELGSAVKGTPRELRPPGTYWEYNDVRVNRLSLSLLQVFRRPLPEVLRNAVMDPIGASTTWEWQPYPNSWVEIDGLRMPSVPGGSHWGGGLWMSTRDHARFGLLIYGGGRWGDHQLLPESWVAEMRRPCAVNPQYGLLWWLNTGRALFKSAPESSYAARGAGSNLIWIDPEHDLVAVVRWIDAASADGFLKLVVESVDR